MSTNPPKQLIEFLKPSELKDYKAPENLFLVGDCHIVKGSVFVIGGAPGVGKSRASVALAVAGASKLEWFGLPVHRQFKTMIVQTENGRFRLSREFENLDAVQLDDWVRICPPPPLGMAFGKSEFVDALKGNVRSFEPDVLILDPWNAAARDDRQKDYLETFETIQRILPLGDEAPALGIVAHTRKPKGDERATGRGLLNLLAGSYVLGSVPRSVFVIQPASDDTQDNRIVWTCCKNNDGEMGPRSAWERRNGLFSPLPEFDWEAFNNPNPDERVKIDAEVLASLFNNGHSRLRKAEGVRRLEELTGASQSACYAALAVKGRFAQHLRERDGLLEWRE